jgi:hypothetical protein
MRSSLSFILKCLLLLFAVQSVQAQQFPVTASTQVIPPYSVYLPDYAVPGSDKLRVILIQNDLTQPSYDVRLQMTVEQNGTLIMRTSAAFHPRPLTLTSGVPTIISGADLSEYLSTNNIEFSGGFSRENYDRTKALPEGAYRITFTAFDYRRPTVQVSNAGANIFFFQKSDPPLLNLPVCGSRVEKHDPQFLSFNWSNRNTPNASTEYVFSLYEIKPKNSNADYIVRSAQPLYTLTTESNTLIYGPGEPQLIDSMEYVWIVQARDKNGRDLFSNQGYSQSCKFTYLGTNPFQALNINKPVLYGSSNGERSAKFWWPLAARTTQYSVETYRIQYRAAGGDFDWYTEEKQMDSMLTLHSLEPGRPYEARLQWRVSGVYGPYSELVTVTTDSLRVFSCGDGNQLKLPDNSRPLPAAIAGNIVRIGNFDVMLTQVSGGEGVFSGTGRVITPGFGMGLPMMFNGISINTDYVVIRGEMQAVTSGIDQFVSDELKSQRGGDDVGQVKTGDIVPDIITKLHIFSKDSIAVDTSIGRITLLAGTEGKQVIDYKKDGKTLPLVIEDADGHLYNIDKNGTVTNAGTRDKSINTATLNNLDLSKGRITFSAAAGNKYAFDTWKDAYSGKAVLDSSYELLGNYRVSAKAIVPGVQESVIATVDGSLDTSKIKFVSGKGIILPFTNKGDHYTVTITGGPGADAQEVYAVCDGKSVGKLLVVSYAPKQRKVVLIPIGTASVPEAAIKSSLSDAYAKIGITYTVETDGSFRNNTSWDTNGDNLLQDSKSAFLSNSFTGEEKAMKKAYAKTHTISDDVTYLFVINEAVISGTDLLGKMPRQSQYGFIFVKNAPAAAVGRTVAHETGHGAYTLEHTFSKSINLSQGSTDNLMDYYGGYALLKYQWDVVHDPGNVWGILEDDAGSDNYTLRTIHEDYLNKDGKTVSFLTPSGTVISLPRAQINSVEFQYGAANTIKGVDAYSAEWASGTLKTFTLHINDQDELFDFNQANNTYTGSVSKTAYKQEVNTELVDGFIYPIPCGSEYYLYKFPVNSIPFYKGGEIPIPFSELAGRFIPFTDATSPLKISGRIIDHSATMNLKAVCAYCASEMTAAITKNHCNSSEILWVDKIAQVRNVFPEYFEKFTQTEFFKPSSYVGDVTKGVWEYPVTIEYTWNGSKHMDAAEWPWGKYLSEHADVRAYYNDPKNKHLFYAAFLKEFVAYVSQAATTDDKFWETFNQETPLGALYDQIEKGSLYHLQDVSLEKKGLALRRILKEGLQGSIATEVPFLRVMSAFRPVDYESLLIYLERNIGIQGIYDFLHNHSDPGNYSKAESECLSIGLMMISNMVTATGHYKVDVATETRLEKKPLLAPQLEADLLQNKNADWNFTGSNNITLGGNYTPYVDIPYSQLISVYIAGSFKLNDKPFEKGALLQMPAIQAVLLSHLNNVVVGEKAAWLTVDAATLVVGIGGANILLTTGNYIRKVLVASDLAGSSIGVVSQLLNNDDISDENRARLQMVGFLLSLPNMAASLQVDAVEDMATHMDEAINATTTAKGTAMTGEEASKMITMSDAYAVKVGLPTIAEDAAQMSQRALTLGVEEMDLVHSSLGKLPKTDNKLYIAVHGDGDVFKVVHNGETVTLNHRSLASWINSKGLSANQDIVLLTCANLETAQNLSKKLKRPIYANDGSVTVFENGVIEAENRFVKIDNTGNVSDADVQIGATGTADGDYVKLGKRFVDADYLPEVRARLTEILAKRSNKASTVDKILYVIQNNEAIGKRFLEKLKSTKYDKVDGFLDVLTNASVDEHAMKASLQAIDRADELLSAGEELTRFRFENKVVIDGSEYDVDFGIRKPGATIGDESYTVAYQFKSNKSPLSKGMVQDNANQLFNAPADKRISEFILIESDNLTNIKSNKKLLQSFELNLYERRVLQPNDVLIDEFHLIFSDGTKVKVIWENEVKFIKF